jgi:hypothetical protein
MFTGYRKCGAFGNIFWRGGGAGQWNVREEDGSCINILFGGGGGRAGE